MKRRYIVGAATVVVLALAFALLLTNFAQTSQLGQSSSATLSNSGESSQRGAFTFLVADPAVAATGVGQVYFRYSEAAAHVTQFGWIQLVASGTIEVTTPDLAQTIASAIIQAGSYDMVRLNVSSATVLYNNQNYSAAMKSGVLVAGLRGNVQVSTSVPSAAVIDVHTIILNAGNSTIPRFLISSSAKATMVPSNDVVGSIVTVGSKTNFQGRAWWNAFVAESTPELQITGATLKSNSLNLNVRNNGRDNTTLHAVAVTPILVVGGTNVMLPPGLSDSALFNINQGTLQVTPRTSLQAVFGGAGMNLAAGSSISLTYSGSINLGLSELGIGLVQGQQYLVTCISNDSAVSIVLMAS